MPSTASVISRGKDHKYADAGAPNSPTLSHHQVPTTSNFQQPTNAFHKQRSSLTSQTKYSPLAFISALPSFSPVRTTPPKLYEACRICFTPKVIYFSPPPGVERKREAKKYETPQQKSSVFSAAAQRIIPNLHFSIINFPHPTGREVVHEIPAAERERFEKWLINVKYVDADSPSRGTQSTPLKSS